MTQRNGSEYKYLGKPRRLVEGAEKVTGHVRYAADLDLPGMHHARPILSPYAHAEIGAIDKSMAEALPGVVAVLTASDLPTRDKVIASRNSAILAKEKVLWRGQPVAVVVAETDAIAADAAELVFIDYTPLPAAVDVLKAMSPDSPIVWPTGMPSADSDLSSAHTSVEQAEGSSELLPPNVDEKNEHGWGDVAQGFAEADVVVEHTYRTSMVHQGYMEPHACVAETDPLGRSLTLHTSTQGAYLVRDEVAKLLSLPVSKVKVVPMTFGGGFGAKYGILEPLAGAVAITLKRPIRLVLTRSEDFATTTPAHGTVIRLKTGAKRDGSLCALSAEIIMDNGVFAFNVGRIAAALLGGYYRCPNVRMEVLEVNTNKPQAGSYRAPSAPQITFALESNMDEMASALGLDPLEFRWQNAVETGDKMGSGNPWPEIGLKDVLAKMREHPAWKERETGANEGVGIAVGGWPSFMGPAAAICTVDTDGSVVVQSGAVDISGVNSSFVLVAAEVLGVSPDAVEIVSGDTQRGPFAPNSGGSQVLYSVAGAVSNAAEAAKEKLLQVAAEQFEASSLDVELVDGHAQIKGVPDRQISLGELVSTARSQKGGVGPIVGEGSNAVPENAPGFVVHLVKATVDPGTGDVTLNRYVSVQDVGFALNPMMVEGQMHGGAVQGIGMGLHEALVFDDGGQLLSGSFMDYDLPRVSSVPIIETVIVEHPSPQGPFGARGIGEPPIIAGPAAIANAIKNATGVRLTELPIRSETLWRAMNDPGEAG
jgi:CO/xanthine dehydrogenase Mo-binding subunit